MIFAVALSLFGTVDIVVLLVYPAIITQNTMNRFVAVEA